MLKKILIVEDEHDVIKLLKYNLEKEGFKVNYTQPTEASLSPKSTGTNPISSFST